MAGTGAPGSRPGGRGCALACTEIGGRQYVHGNARPPSLFAKQAPREERLEKAALVVDNSGSLDDLAPQIDACWAWIEGHRTAE